MTDKDSRWNKFIGKYATRNLVVIGCTEKRSPLFLQYDAEMNSGAFRV